jgi:Tfp pilus assembly pilus retraction ATPase PilT
MEIPYTLSNLLHSVARHKGDAIHLHEGEVPVFEVKRQLLRTEGPCLKPGDTYAWLAMHASEEDLARFQSSGVNCFYHRTEESFVWQFMAFKENGHVRLEIRKFQ